MNSVILFVPALEIKGATNSVCLRRIVALCGSGVYGCSLGVYGVRFGSVWVSPAHSVVQTGYTTPTLRFSGYTKPPRGCNVTYINMTHHVGKTFDHEILGQTFDHEILGQTFDHEILGQTFDHVILGQTFDHEILGQMFDHEILGQSPEMMSLLKSHILLYKYTCTIYSMHYYDYY